MNTWYVIFSLVALPGILTVLLPADEEKLEEDEATTRVVAAPAKKPEVPMGYLPHHSLQQQMATYRIFYRAPVRHFF
jgi:hypothetical protein